MTRCGPTRVPEEDRVTSHALVTRDLPDGVFAAGNPCRTIREITE
jgi:maltose O-acetyltransferase